MLKEPRLVKPFPSFVWANFVRMGFDWLHSDPTKTELSPMDLAGVLASGDLACVQLLLGT